MNENKYLNLLVKRRWLEKRGDDFFDKENVMVFTKKESRTDKGFLKCYPYEKENLSLYDMKKTVSWNYEENIEIEHVLIDIKFFKRAIMVFGSNLEITCSKKLIPVRISNPESEWCCYIAPRLWYLDDEELKKNFEHATGCTCPVLIRRAEYMREPFIDITPIFT